MNQEKSNPTRTPYKILGISPDASMSEIENACQRAKLHCNPSNFEEDSPERERAIRRSEDITTAYAALTEEKMEPLNTQNTTTSPHEKLSIWFPLLLIGFLNYFFLALIGYFFNGRTSAVDEDGERVDMVHFLYFLSMAFLYSLITAIAPTLLIYFAIAIALPIATYAITSTPILPIFLTIFSLLWTLVLLSLSHQVSKELAYEFEFGKREPFFIKTSRRLSLGYSLLHKELKRDVLIIRNQFMGIVRKNG